MRNPLQKVTYYRVMPLVIASENGRLEVVQALLAAGADVNAKRSDGATVLMLASMNDYRKMAQALLTAGAEVVELLKNAGANE